MKKKKSKLALIALILSVLYAIYLVSYFTGAVTNETDSAAAVGAGLASVIVMPHLIAVVIGAITNAIGYFFSSRGFILSAGILYTVALVLFPMYFMFVIIQLILCFVAYVRMKPTQV